MSVGTLDLNQLREAIDRAHQYFFKRPVKIKITNDCYSQLKANIETKYALVNAPETYTSIYGIPLEIDDFVIEYEIIFEDGGKLDALLKHLPGIEEALSKMIAAGADPSKIQMLTSLRSMKEIASIPTKFGNIKVICSPHLPPNSLYLTDTSIFPEGWNAPANGI